MISDKNAPIPDTRAPTPAPKMIPIARPVRDIVLNGPHFLSPSTQRVLNLTLKMTKVLLPVANEVTPSKFATTEVIC